LAEVAVDKRAKSLRCRLLSEATLTKLDIEFYQDGRDALLKAVAE
jgi:ATP-dependent Lon protease